MSKFVIECPHCGSYAEASTGFLGIGKTHTINCSCGRSFSVAANKMASRTCAHCGNDVIFDQSKGEDAVCPVCHERINTRASMAALVQFSCPSCSCKLSADKNADTYTCPLCDTIIDVQKQIEKEKAKNQGLASIIKYEGDNNTFVWKHPIEDFNLGSQLIVHESQEAIFFRDGKALDLFGAGRYTLATQNLPILEDLFKLPFNGNEVFHSEVYFINMTTQMGIKWGTPNKVRLFDPGSGLHIEIGACGNFSMRVKDSRKLIVKVVGTTDSLNSNDIASDGGSMSLAQSAGKFKPLITNRIASNLPRIIKEQNINILEIDSYLDIISEKLGAVINETLDDYGLVMPEFFVTAINLPEDKNFQRLREQFAQRTLGVRQADIEREIAEAEQKKKLVEAQTAAQVKMVGAQGEAEALKIKALAEAEAYKAQAFAEADEMRAKGYTYQQETARQVGLEAMQNGITGGSGSAGSGLGDIASLGVTLGAMGGVMNLTKDALSPIMSGSAEVGTGIGNALASSTAAESWNCPKCGEKNITRKFCPECGEPKPRSEAPDSWDCPRCGEKGITRNFCPECGEKRPAPVIPDTWDCPKCGEKGITRNFCPECGEKRPAANKPDTWDCSCGEKNITAKFCPECGKPRGAEQ